MAAAVRFLELTLILFVFTNLICYKNLVKCSVVCSKEAYAPCSHPNSTFVEVPDIITCVRLVATEQTSCWRSLHQCKAQNERLLSNWSKDFEEKIIEIFEASSSSKGENFWVDMRYYQKREETIGHPQSEQQGYQMCATINHTDHTPFIHQSLGRSIFRLLVRNSYICQSENFKDRSDTITITLNLDMQPNGTDIVGNCFAHAGATGMVSMYIVRTTSMTEITRDDPRLIFYNEYFVKSGDHCERRITTSFIIKAKETLGNVNNLEEIVCKLHSKLKSGDCSSDGVKCAVKGVRITDQNLLLTLTVNFHSPPPDVHLTSDVVFTCSSCAGPDANLSWSIQSAGVSRTIFPKHSSLTYQNETLPCGVNITSTYSFPITKATASQIVSCSSYMIYNGFKRNKLTIKSSDLSNVDFYSNYPAIPHLTVRYHMHPSRVIVSWEMSAYCHACVGNNGNMSWELVDNNNISVDPHQLKYLLLRQNVTTDPHIPFCGDNVTIKIFLKVTHIMNDTRLVCQSHGRTKNEEIVLRTAGLLFVVILIDEYPVHKTSSNGLLPFLLGFLILIVLFGIARKCFEQWDKETTSKPKDAPHQKRAGVTRPGKKQKRQDHRKPRAGDKFKKVKTSRVKARKRKKLGEAKKTKKKKTSNRKPAVRPSQAKRRDRSQIKYQKQSRPTSTTSTKSKKSQGKSATMLNIGKCESRHHSPDRSPSRWTLVTADDHVYRVTQKRSLDDETQIEKE